MEPYRVFISSIMNRSVEDLFAEREAARSAVEHYAPITTPWVFEAEPASPKPPPDFYINGVKNSDLFVLIIGQRLTKPVRNEYDTARDHGKPMLVFARPSCLAKSSAASSRSASPFVSTKRSTMPASSASFAFSVSAECAHLHGFGDPRQARQSLCSARPGN